jgi:hypothetical protein
MKTAIAILTLLLISGPMAMLCAETVLIVLREPSGPVSQRLATLPQSTPVPDEIRAAAERERSTLRKAQQDSFDGRLAAAGATGVVHYAALDMIRADVPFPALISLQTDPAVVSVTPLSGDAPATLLQANLLQGGPGAGVQPAPAGAAIGGLPHKPGSLQSPLFPMASPAMMATPPPMTSAPAFPLPGAMPGVNLPGAMPFMSQPTAMPPGTGMFQALLGTTSQLSAQAGMAMPRSAGLMVLLAGGAQIAQVIAANHKPSCTITLDTTSARIPAAGGQGTIFVKASPSCLWQAQSNSEWLQMDGSSPTMGSGVVRYTATASESSRSAMITIAGIVKTTVRGRGSIVVRQGP